SWGCCPTSASDPRRGRTVPYKTRQPAGFSLCSDAVRRGPVTTMEETFARAVSAHQAGDLDGAERLYREILDADPRHSGALSNLGVITAKKGDLAEAARLYRAAIAANPNQIDAHFNLGNVFRKTNRP